MINYIINYIVYTQGHRRHHAGTQTQLFPPRGDPPTLPGGQSSPGEHFSVFAPAEWVYMGQNLSFAFMSVAGNIDHNHLYTTPGIKNVNTGTGDITITIVYAPPGGGNGHGGPGIWVDAFNVDRGDFSDNDFMQVFTDGSLDNAKTLTANNDGVVSSATAEDMRANSTVEGVPFLQWEKLGNPNMPVRNSDYMLAQNEGGIAFAFYQSPEIQIPDVPQTTTEGGWINVSKGVALGIGGFGVRAGSGVIEPFPHPSEILIAKLMTTAVLLSVSSNMSEEVKKQAISLAANHLDSIKQFITGTELNNQKETVK